MKLQDLKPYLPQLEKDYSGVVEEKMKIVLRKFHDLRCPVCKGYVETEVDEYRYCPTCGQRIDWSEQECTGSSEDEYNTVRNSKGE